MAQFQRVLDARPRLRFFWWHEAARSASGSAIRNATKNAHLIFHRSANFARCGFDHWSRRIAFSGGPKRRRSQQDARGEGASAEKSSAIGEVIIYVHSREELYTLATERTSPESRWRGPPNPLQTTDRAPRRRQFSRRPEPTYLPTPPPDCR